MGKVNNTWPIEVAVIMSNSLFKRGYAGLRKDDPPKVAGMPVKAIWGDAIRCIVLSQ